MECFNYKKMFIKLIFAVAVSFFYAFSLSAQVGITGVVNDDTGSPMPGVNVIVKNTTTGSVTDVNGKYTISVPDDNAILQFSSVGFATQEITVGNRRVIDVDMAEDAQQIEEVVVVGVRNDEKERFNRLCPSVECR